MTASQKIRVGIFGTGNIGTDLLIKLSRVPSISVCFVIGRRNESPGIQEAVRLGYRFSVDGLDGLEKELACNPVDWVADTSTASLHKEVRNIVERNSNARILDFTPSELSTPFVPMIDLDETGERDLGLISCGAQSSIPLLAVVANHFKLSRVELASSLASKSVGPATRINLDEYIEKTEKALAGYCSCPDVKAILIVNPAIPPINMSVSLYLRSEDSKFTTNAVDLLLAEKTPELLKHIPNFKLLGPTVIKGEDLLISYEVTGSGDYLPLYAGNLDVLTHAAAGIMSRSKV